MWVLGRDIEKVKYAQTIITTTMSMMITVVTAGGGMYLITAGQRMTGNIMMKAVIGTFTMNRPDIFTFMLKRMIFTEQ